MKKALLILCSMVICTSSFSQSLLTTITSFTRQTDTVPISLEYTTNIQFGGGYGQVLFALGHVVDVTQNVELDVFKVLVDGETEVPLYGSGTVSGTTVVWAPTGSYLVKDGEQIKVTFTGDSGSDSTGYLQFFIKRYQ